MYEFSSLSIAGALMLAIIVANEMGHRVGIYIQEQTDHEVKALTGAAQASVLGLLALLLGFTFSIAMQRFDARSHAVIDEANAIGTAMLRAELLPDSHRNDATAQLERYTAMRVLVGSIDLTRSEERAQLLTETAELQRRLWHSAIGAAEVDPRPLTTGAFANALTAVFDSQSRRNALLQMHVPEPVLVLLFLVFISSGAMMGYSSGLGGTRLLVPSSFVAGLIVLIVFIIIDLDRPRRGVIQVDQSLLHDPGGSPERSGRVER